MYRAFNRIVIMGIIIYIFAYLRSTNPNVSVQDDNVKEMFSVKFHKIQKDTSTIICYADPNNTNLAISSYKYSDFGKVKEVLVFKTSRNDTMYICHLADAVYFEKSNDDFFKAKSVRLMWISMAIIFTCFLLAVFCYCVCQFNELFLRKPALLVIFALSFFFVILQMISFKQFVHKQNQQE